MPDPVAASLRIAPEALTRPFSAEQFSFTTTNEAEKSKIVTEWTRRGAILEGYTVDLEPGKGVTVLKAPKKERLRQSREPSVHRAVLSSLRGRVEGGSPNPVFVDPESELWLIPTREIIVRLRPGADAAGYFGAEWNNARRVLGTTDQFVLSVSGLTAEQLLAEVNRRATDAQVLWVEPNFLTQNVNHLVPNDTLYPNQWHLNNRNIVYLHDIHHFLRPLAKLQDKVN